MKVIRYQKLVRDRIPEIIEDSGKHCVYSVLSEREYIESLDAKLDEELSEYQESKSIEELADLIEVVRAIVSARGYSMEELEKIRRAKADQRGGFMNRIQLLEVASDD